MSAPDQALDRYIAAVLSRIPRGVAERARIASDVRTHILERVEAGQPLAEALEQMGAPEEVARAYLEEIGLPLARLSRRLGAFLIDLLLGMLVVGPALAVWFGVVLVPLWEMEVESFPVWWMLPSLFIVTGVSTLVLSVLYFPALEALYGQTLGKRLLGICVTTESREPIGWGADIVRRLPLFLEIFWIDAVFALFTRNRQRAFDLLAKTVVVECRAPVHS